MKDRCPDIHNILVHTGQHSDANMSEVFFKELEIPRAVYNLAKPNKILVYSDINSTLAGTLVTVELYIFLVHVDADPVLQSHHAEEINGVPVDHSSDLFIHPVG